MPHPLFEKYGFNSRSVALSRNANIGMGIYMTEKESKLGHHLYVSRFKVSIFVTQMFQTNIEFT